MEIQEMDYHPINKLSFTLSVASFIGMMLTSIGLHTSLNKTNTKVRNLETVPVSVRSPDQIEIPLERNDKIPESLFRSDQFSLKDAPENIRLWTNRMTLIVHKGNKKLYLDPTETVYLERQNANEAIEIHKNGDDYHVICHPKLFSKDDFDFFIRNDVSLSYIEIPTENVRIASRKEWRP